MSLLWVKDPPLIKPLMAVPHKAQLLLAGKGWKQRSKYSSTDSQGAKLSHMSVPVSFYKTRSNLTMQDLLGISPP